MFKLWRQKWHSIKIIKVWLRGYMYMPEKFLTIKGQNHLFTLRKLLQCNKIDHVLLVSKQLINISQLLYQNIHKQNTSTNISHIYTFPTKQKQTPNALVHNDTTMAPVYTQINHSKLDWNLISLLQLSYNCTNLCAINCILNHI